MNILCIKFKRYINNANEATTAKNEEKELFYRNYTTGNISASVFQNGERRDLP